VGRQRRVIEIWVLTAIAGTLLLAGAMVGCGSGVGEENADGRGGERGSAAATDGVTTAPGEDRQATGAARGLASLDAEVVSPGDDYLPAGFGEGSLWASDPITCNDGGPDLPGVATLPLPRGAPPSLLLRR